MDKSKLATGALFSAPPVGGTLAAYAAYRLGVPVDVVIAGAAFLGQGLHALASLVNGKRKAKKAA